MNKNFSGQQRRLVEQLKGLGIQNKAVLERIEKTPRHMFISESLAHRAYENNALPIGEGQTISQPYMVAKMTELLLEGDASIQRVLEIGTGSGYQTAILAPLVQKVFSVERIISLQYQARRRLQKLDLYNIHMKHGDGWEGWSNQAPFDGILVTAAASRIPEKLLAQLSPNQGRLIIPVGESKQELFVIVRQGEQYIKQVSGQVRFVPLVQGERT